MNSTRFNFMLGLLSIASFMLFRNVNFVSLSSNAFVAILLLLIYIADFWAFLFKLKIAKIRVLHKLTSGNPHVKIAMGREPGGLVFYAFLMRLVFRFALVLVIITAFGGDFEKEEVSTFQIILMICVTLFELFNMLYSIFETHIYKLLGEDAETKKDIDDYWESEKKWRSKNYPLAHNKNSVFKENIASAILLITAILVTNLVWTSFNNQFIEFIISSANNNDSAIATSLIVIISLSLLCLFFLMPIRLAFWIEEKMKIEKKTDKIRYRFSLFFAGISICTPSLIQLLKSFI
ncbi:MAG: hypothetical protein V4667_08750 [Bacteroidota bacterium]